MLLAGFGYTEYFYSRTHDGHVLVLGAVGTLIALAIGMGVNLLYFLPVRSVIPRFILPGILHVFFAKWEWQDDISTLKFMALVAIVNAMFGVWKAHRFTPQSDSETPAG